MAALCPCRTLAPVHAPPSLHQRHSWSRPPTRDIGCGAQRQLADRPDDRPDDGQIVASCRGAYCVLAHDAVRLPRAQGRHATRPATGMPEWRRPSPARHRDTPDAVRVTTLGAPRRVTRTGTGRLVDPPIAADPALATS